jgi:hypothetical protein
MILVILIICLRAGIGEEEANQATVKVHIIIQLLVSHCTMTELTHQVEIHILPTPTLMERDGIILVMVG